MEYRYEMPIGFGMELSMNADAMRAFSGMPETDRQEVLKKARSARTREEMTEIVNRLAGGAAVN